MTIARVIVIVLLLVAIGWVFYTMNLSKPATTLKIKQGFNECARLDHLERALRHAHKASTVRFGSWATFRHRRGSLLLPLGQRAQVRRDFLQSLRTPLLHRFAILVGKEGG